MTGVPLAPAPAAPGPPFEETAYGIVKRLAVIEAWIAEVAGGRGRRRLRILDYGCGTGDHLTAPLARAGHEVLGVDAHAPSVAEARRRHRGPALAFRVGTLEDLLASGDAFDVVVCSEVLEHVDAPRPFLAGLRRLVAPDGVLIVTTPNGYGAFELLRGLERFLRRLGVHQLGAALAGRRRTPAREPGFLNADSPHVQFFRVAALETLFAGCGLRIRARRARSLLCGPYADHLFALGPAPRTLFRANNRLADLFPFSWAADWMFLLEPQPPTRR
jgi:SAM-dependent methyltransferase